MVHIPINRHPLQITTSTSELPEIITWAPTTTVMTTQPNSSMIHRQFLFEIIPSIFDNQPSSLSTFVSILTTIPSDRKLSFSDCLSSSSGPLQLHDWNLKFLKPHLRGMTWIDLGSFKVDPQCLRFQTWPNINPTKFSINLGHQCNQTRTTRPLQTSYIKNFRSDSAKS